MQSRKYSLLEINLNRISDAIRNTTKQILKEITVIVKLEESPWFPLLRNGECAAASKMQSDQKIK